VRDSRIAVRVALALAVLLLAGCGGSSKPSVPEGFPAGAKVQVHDLGGGWKIVWATGGARSYAAVERDGKRVAPGGLTVRVLGPDAGEQVGSIPQVAAAIKAPSSVEDYTLLVDGTPLDAKSGGLSQRDISVYGAPSSSLSPGRHVAVAAARAGGSAAATAWTFTVR
jgi:hypothetical protein